MKVGDKMKWKNVKDGSWAGSGRCEITGYDPARAYFGHGANGANVPGPAVKIRLVDATPGFDDAWVRPEELEPDLDPETQATLAAIQAEAAQQEA